MTNANELNNKRFCGAGLLKNEIQISSIISKKHKLNPSRKLSTQFSPIRIILDTSDFELQAMLLASSNLKEYTLLIRSNVGAANILPIVCHEMWHLNQMYHNKLQIVGKNFKWNGKSYPGSTPYFERPWEKEAIKEQTEIENKVKKLYYE